MTLAGRTIFMSGGSRGIGLAIALRAARDGANVIIAAKTDQPHPRLPGTIHSAAAEVEAAGGRALALVCDVRDADAVQRAVDAGAAHFGGIDIVVNNASAIRLGGVSDVDVKALDLMLGIGPRACYAVTRAALPHLERSAAAGRNPHVLTLSPPLAIEHPDVGRSPAYTLNKFGMTLLALAMAAEFRDRGIASNALWPRTTIATAAVANLLGGERVMRASRTPQIVADAAHAVLIRPAAYCTGNAFIDDVVLAEDGMTDFEQYRVDPSVPLAPDIYVDEGTGSPVRAHA